ncbi:hypothetical protein DPSP01_006656 [Paraphaeosphaeria sporulosa]
MLRSPMSLPSLPDRQPMDHSDGSSNSSPDTCPEIRSRSNSREESQQPPPQPRKPIPRKGHTKSRRGCYNCKRRRIKCNEKHPECNHCIKAGLRCEYPANIIQTTQRSLLSPNPQEMVNLRSTPGVFTMADMRLFHHFLITAYPHLPVGADKIWITVIPSFAHNYEYLIHSILALAASHLDAVSSANVAEEAISHRILAVKALNEALSVPPKTRNERDARMAAALALAFQSSHLQDGLLEFLTMVRGCNLIALEGTLDTVDSAFHAFREDGHLATMRTRMCASQQNFVDRDDLDLAALSIHDIELLNMTDWERMFWDALIRTVENAYDRPIQAYTTFVQLPFYRAASCVDADFDARKGRIPGYRCTNLRARMGRRNLQERASWVETLYGVAQAGDAVSNDEVLWAEAPRLLRVSMGLGDSHLIAKPILRWNRRRRKFWATVGGTCHDTLAVFAPANALALLL